MHPLTCLVGISWFALSRCVNELVNEVAEEQNGVDQASSGEISKKGLRFPHGLFSFEAVTRLEDAPAVLTQAVTTSKKALANFRWRSSPSHMRTVADAEQAIRFFEDAIYGPGELSSAVSALSYFGYLPSSIPGLDAAFKSISDSASEMRSSVSMANRMKAIIRFLESAESSDTQSSLNEKFLEGHRGFYARTISPSLGLESRSELDQSSLVRQDLLAAARLHLDDFEAAGTYTTNDSERHPSTTTSRRTLCSPRRTLPTPLRTLAELSDMERTRRLRLSRYPNLSVTKRALALKRLVSVRNELAHLGGWKNYGAYERRHTASAAYEQARGRDIKQYDMQSCYVARFLRAAAHAIMPVLQNRVNAVGSDPEKYKRLYDLETSQVPKATLRQALNGFVAVAKSLLGVRIDIDHTQDVWSDSSLVLRVSTQAGDLKGRIFIETNPDSPWGLRPWAQLTRGGTANGEPGISIVNLYAEQMNLQAAEHNTVAGEHNTVRSPSMRDETSMLPPSIGARLDSLGLSTGQFISAFHELAHALHCILSDVYFKRLTVTTGPIDYLELPSLLFELLARDWLDFLLGKTLNDSPSPLSMYFPWQIDKVFRLGVGQYCLYEGSECTMATLLGIPGLQIGERFHPLNNIDGILLGTPYYGYIYAYSFAPMVYSRGHYREKMWSIFQEYASIPKSGTYDTENLLAMDSLALSESETGIRKFFESGLRNFGFDTFLNIVPGLERAVRESNNVEDVVDFEPFIAELNRD